MLTQPSAGESAPVLVPAPRPLILFVREGVNGWGSPQVIAKFLDESMELTLGRLTLNGARIGNRKISLSWAGTEGIASLDVEGFREYYWSRLISLPLPASAVEIDEQGITKFRLVGYTPSGVRVESNEIDVGANRRRVVGRDSATP